MALGTVADVAPLDGDNRRLVRAGLARIASPRPRPGVLALREAARIRAGASVGGVDIAFRMAPRLNAAGRLGDPEVTLRLLQAATLPEARVLAARIEQINQERRAIERRITEEAIEQVLDVYGEEVSGGIVVAASGWHRGVVGIVAARLVERFEAPTVVIALEDGEGHGSCRTPEGFSIYDAVAACRGDLSKFGGHAAAAGLSLDAARVEPFRAGFDDVCRSMRAVLPPLDATPRIDVALGDGFPLPTAAELAMLEPVGEGNAEPLFLLEGATVRDVNAVGDGQHLKLALRMGDRDSDGVRLGARRPRSHHRPHRPRLRQPPARLLARRRRHRAPDCRLRLSRRSRVVATPVRSPASSEARPHGPPSEMGVVAVRVAAKPVGRRGFRLTVRRRNAGQKT